MVTGDKEVGVNRTFAFSRVLTSFLLVLCMSEAGAQQDPPPLTVPDYKAGQVWTYKTAPGAEDSRIVILRLEPAGKKGRIIHVRVENLPLPSCGGFHLTTAIEHLAISEEACDAARFSSRTSGLNFRILTSMLTADGQGAATRK
jgi:hypothetical protein